MNVRSHTAASPARTPHLSVGLAWFASLKLSAAVIAAMLAGVAYSFHTGTPPTWSLAGPLVLFALNLGAAVLVNPAFRRQLPLLVFHLALVALAALVAGGRLSYLRGTLELTQGESLAGRLIEFDAGPLHPWRIGQVSFTNQGFEIDYAPGMRRGDTRNRVTWRDESGAEREAVIGDHRPLVMAGYRFYTTPNKGFAPVFLWQPHDGPPQRGTLHMPAYPVFQYGQTLEWKLPDGSQLVRASLEIDEVIIDLERPSQFRLPAEHQLRVEAGSIHTLLRPGDTVALANGTLTYEGLLTWMGYLVFYDWTLPWLAAAALLATAALGWHYWSKYGMRPWSACGSGNER